MAKKYIKNSFGYVEPIYRKSYFWILLNVFFLVISYLGNFVVMKLNFENNFFRYLNYLLLIILFLQMLAYIYVLFKELRKNKGLINFFYSSSLNKNIISSFVDTMSLNKMISSKSIQIPAVEVDLTTETAGYVSVIVERLPGMNDLDILINNINSSFRGKYKDFAIKSYSESLDGLSYTFVLENVNFSKRLVPKHLGEIICKDKYSLTLQKDLVWNLNSNPHCIVTGKTGSGKSTFLLSLLIQILYNDWIFYIIDPKLEFSAFDFIGDKIFSNKSDVLDFFDKLIDDLSFRQEEVKTFVKSTGLIGGTAYDFDMKPIIVIFDEFSAFVSSLDNKEKKEFDNKIVQVVQKGRSVGIFLVVAMQNANSEVIKIAIRNQFSLRILLGKGSSEDIRFMFGSLPDFNFSISEKFTGYFYLDGFTEQPEKLYITDFYTHGIGNIESFKKAYNKGIR